MRAVLSFLLGFTLAFFYVNFFLIQPVFSPEEGWEIVEMIENARFSISAEVYAFTSWQIAKALVEAKRRGVNVRIIIDSSTLSSESREILNYLKGEGVSVRVINFYRRMHAKFFIIDGITVFVGSHNFSHSALKYNREAGIKLSLLRFYDFQKIFEEDWKKARTY